MVLIVVLILFLFMCGMWLWYRYEKNPSVVDVGWAMGLTLGGLVILSSQGYTSRSMLLGMILLIWGIRLSGYLWLTRIRHHKVDERYLKLSQDWKISKPLGFFLNFQFQAFLMLILLTPWFFAAKVMQINSLDILGILLALFAISGESLADYQLQQFKRQHSKQVCNVGLWYYSRHPNYFFEWLTWCAFTLFALSHSYGWIGLISPLTLYLIMTKVTGPMTENGSIESRGAAYLAYQKTTPMFFPNVLKQ